MSRCASRRPRGVRGAQSVPVIAHATGGIASVSQRTRRERERLPAHWLLDTRRALQPGLQPTATRVSHRDRRAWRGSSARRDRDPRVRCASWALRSRWP
eukprot:scaffold125692_cov42-Phaeocystis_antarctica.AAC.2